VRRTHGPGGRIAKNRSSRCRAHFRGAEKG
jgi:hypothetical protein